MPYHDDSLIGILVPYCKIFTTFMFYLAICAGMIGLVIICLTPFFMVFNGYKSVTIKMKSKKKYSKKQIKNMQKKTEDTYFNKLEKKIK